MVSEYLFTVRKLEGISIPCLASPYIVVDDQNLRFFLLGPHPTSASKGCILSQWRVTDSGLRCEDLTPSLRRDFQPPPVPLPSLQDPAITYTTIHGCEYILMLGLSKTTNSSPEMKLAAVDVSTKLWFYIPVDCRMRPRTRASIVTVDQRLYVFGGKDECGNEISAYCIAECIDCRWHWIVLERSYPSHVSSLGCNGAATLVQGAGKVLLTSTSMELVRTVVTFDVASEEFEIVSETVGGSWSHVYATTSLPPTMPTLRKRSVLPVVAAVVCGQPASREEGSLELWRYLLPPYNDLRRLNVDEQVQELDLEMPFFVSVAGRHFICGSQVVANVPRYDACVEIDVEQALDIQSSHVPNVLSSSSSPTEDAIEEELPLPLRQKRSLSRFTSEDELEAVNYVQTHSQRRSRRSVSKDNTDGTYEDTDDDDDDEVVSSIRGPFLPLPGRRHPGVHGLRVPVTMAEPERPHVCQHKGCHSAFKRSEHLKRHIKEVHLKSKPHQCRRCRSWFSRRSNLTQHDRTCTS